MEYRPFSLWRHNLLSRFHFKSLKGKIGVSCDCVILCGQNKFYNMYRVSHEKRPFCAALRFILVVGKKKKKTELNIFNLI